MPDPIPPLAYVGHEDTMRLACCTTVHGDIEVETGPEINLFGENFFPLAVSGERLVGVVPGKTSRNHEPPANRPLALTT